jgi:hypothetical protein
MNRVALSSISTAFTTKNTQDAKKPTLRYSS